MAYKNVVKVSCYTLRALQIIQGGTAVVIGWSTAIPALVGAVFGIIL